MAQKDEVTIFLEDKKFTAKKGQSLMQALSEQGIFLRADCGGNGRCTKCSVKIIHEFRENSVGEFNNTIIKTGSEARNVLACQTTITSNLVIEIPHSAFLSPDVIQKPEISRKLKTRISGLIKNNGHPASGYCLAIDLGTTTIGVYLCNMENATIEGSLSLKNPQALFGSDVMSRITALSENPMILRRLQQVAVKAIDWGIRKLCIRHDHLDPKNIRRMAVVGNSIMLHLFLGKDPSSIGTAPYSPQFYETQTLISGRLGFSFNDDVKIFTLPIISGFLGADIVAASLAVDLKNAPFGTILVDVGTNGELMAVGRDSMIAASCATGPAFEGAAVKHGMQAVPGAISAVSIDRKTGQVDYTVKGNQKPRGICGSGIISAVAELLRAKLLLPDGRFNSQTACKRIRSDHKNIPEFVLVDEKESGTGKAITLTQADIRNVQLAKGAFRSGIDLLCEKIGVATPCRLLVAGAFGNFIPKKDALAIGMLPSMQENKIQIVGNAAGEGAILTLYDPHGLDEARKLADTTQVIDLSSLKNFQDHFIDSLSFPEH